MLFDTHTHINHRNFESNRAEFIENARAAGVMQMIAVACTAADSFDCIQIASEYKGVYASVGIQPNYVGEAGPDDWAKIEELATSPGVVAIGETGLDRYWDDTPFDQQQDYFDRHMQLARRHDLPFIVHMRDCEADIMESLHKAHHHGPLKGIMHSFTGDADMAVECVELGMHISFAGMVTFKKSEALRECAASVPSDRLLIETDAPYLSPEPVRGKRPNEPANVRHTAQCLAEVRGVSLEELAKTTTANAKALFSIA